MLTIITVITVCYNAEKLIEDTIKSVVNQSYPYIEYIIVDGLSSDRTMEIVQKYSDKITTIVSEKDNGIYDAMNKGIALATGDYINFMNAGDSFVASDVVSNIIETIDNKPDIIYGDTIYKSEIRQYYIKPYPLQEITHHMVFGHQATFVKTEVMKSKKFDVKFKSSADYDFLYSCYKDRLSFKYVAIPVALYDIRGGMSIDNYRIVLRENAMVTGEIEKPFWIFKYYLQVFERGIKRTLHRILPHKMNDWWEKKAYSPNQSLE